MATVKTTDEHFKVDVLEAKLPVLVDFWAPWCAPCRTVGPILEELSEEYAGKLIIAKLDVDQAPKVAAAFRIQSIPTLVLFRDGRAVQAVQGALPKPQLKQTLAKWLPELKGPMIAVAELARRLAAKEQIHLFDLRRKQDFDRSHLRGSRVVDETELENQVALLAKNEAVVLIDRTGELSRQKAEALSRNGRAEVFALEKGLLEWEGSGQPTFSTREEEAAQSSG